MRFTGHDLGKKRLEMHSLYERFELEFEINFTKEAARDSLKDLQSLFRSS